MGRANADVLVVGGGPAGSSAAFALARAGADVILLDRARFPRPKPCAEVLSPEASRILASMGALAAVEAAGPATLSGILVRAPNGAEIRGRFAAPHRYRPFSDTGFSVRRELLDPILLEAARAAGARVCEGARVVDVVRDRAGTVAGVHVLEAGGRTREVPARFVVAADGLRSTIAHRLGLSRTIAGPRRLALVTHYAGVRGVTDLAEMHVELDGYVGIADVGHGQTTVALVVPAARGREIAGARAEFFEHWLLTRPHLRARFAGATRVSPVRATGPFASHARRAWAPGVLLAGDAADFFDPFTGEGIYAALRGGELAAAAALEHAGHRAGDEHRALTDYEDARRREFAGKWRVERIIAAIVGTPALINRAARSLSARPDMADLLAGVTGNFVPAGEVLRASYLIRAFVPPLRASA